MNKDILNQLAAGERPAAETLVSAAEKMKVSPAFESKLETQLMKAYADKTRPSQGWYMKIARPLAWTALAVCGALLLNWAIQNLVPTQPVAEPTPLQEVSFEEKVRQGRICAEPLAVAHGFDVFLTNPDKTQFLPVDPGKSIGEIRSFAWSSDGARLALLGNTTGSGNIYLLEPGGEPAPVLRPGELGYMMEMAWSRDGKRFALWSAQNNKSLYMMNADGTGLEEKPLGAQILGGLQFWPDGSSIVFYGATPTSSGLFEMMLIDSQVTGINFPVESAGSYAFSPDGTQIAFVEYNHELGEAELFSENLKTYQTTFLGSFSIPKGSGSSVPQTANLSWSADGKRIVFDVGRGANDRVIYLAAADGTGMIQAVDSGYAPSISADGNCLAYINNGQVLLMDLTLPPGSAVPPLLLGALPAGKSVADFQLDRLGWRP